MFGSRISFSLNWSKYSAVHGSIVCHSWIKFCFLFVFSECVFSFWRVAKRCHYLVEKLKILTIYRECYRVLYTSNVHTQFSLRNSVREGSYRHNLSLVMNSAEIVQNEYHHQIQL